MESRKHPQYNRFIGKPRISEEFPHLAENIYDLLKVDPKEDDNLRILDQFEEDNLILVHYLDPTPNTEHVRGIVIDVKQKKIVAESFPHTEEYLASSKEALTVPIGERCEVTKAYEGTILRMFKGDVTGTWYLSTHRKINGRRSRWAGPEFGKMFDEVWGPEKWEDYFVPDNCYVFLLSHGANRLVCEIPSPCLYHVQTFCSTPDGRMVATNIPLQKGHPNVKQQLRLNISSSEELIRQAVRLNWRDCSGLLVTQYDPNGIITKCWKLIPEEYQSRRSIRGNEPNFRYRYLQLKEEGREKEILDLFPEKKDVFDQVEKDLANFPTFLSSYYSERYHKRHFTYLPREVHCLLESTKKQYDHDVPIDENIKRCMEANNARELNAMIRFMNQEKKTLE